MTDVTQKTHSSRAVHDTPPDSRGSGKQRRLLLLGVLLSLLLFGVPLLLAVMAVENGPLVIETSVPTVDSAQRAKSLAKAVLGALNGQRKTTSIAASEEELNAVMTLIRRGVPRVAARAGVRPGGLALQASFRLPSNPLGRYLNLQGVLLPGQGGIHLDSVKIGRVRLPRRPAQALLRGTLNQLLGNDEGTALLNSVQSLDISARTVTVNLRSVPELKARLKRLQAKLSDIRDLATGGDIPWESSHVSAYYSRLLETDQQLLGSTSSSLADYLGPLFRLARHRSVAGDPVRENSTALLALAIFLGDYRFEKLAGITLDPAIRGRMPHSRQVRLAGREDLRLHFVISAGLKLLTDMGVSSVIGELKELLDAGQGGSGFSFVDLAADRSGIRFAELATASAESARRLQSLVAEHPSEAAFFPNIADLPENITRASFERQYRGVDSRRYQELVRELDRRIALCPIHTGEGVAGQHGSPTP